MHNSLLTFLCVLSLIYTACAHQVRPEGGPPDKTPPEIIKVIPDNGSTLVSRNQSVEFEFSEGMSRQGFEKAIFITPNPGERVRFKWKGRRLRITFQDSLLADRTYVITLGTDLKDARNNALRQSYTLAFSTGAFISSGEISGRAFYDKTHGILLWAYILDANEDPDPANEDSDYVTQTDDQGIFQLKNLSTGRYRVFAIHDTDNNRFFEKGIDAIGVPERDIVLESDSSKVEGLNLRLTLVDTIGPALTSVTAADRYHVGLRFDEALSTQSKPEPGNFSIQAQDGGHTVNVTHILINREDRAEVFLTTSQQNPKTTYILRVSQVRDESGNLIDPNYNSLEFTSNAMADTVRPRILSVLPADGSKAVLLTDSISVQFNEPIDRQRLARAFHLLDSTGTRIEGTLESDDSSTFTYIPAMELSSAAYYRVEARLDSIYDLYGNAVAKDSLWTLRLRTVDSDTFAAILGTITDTDSQAIGNLVISAKQSKRDGATYRLELPEPGPYKFEPVLPGTYTIAGFRDRNGDGAYSFGETKPFVAAERFFVYSDSIKVRSRWPNEGNDIVLK